MKIMKKLTELYHFVWDKMLYYGPFGIGQHGRLLCVLVFTQTQLGSAREHRSAFQPE